MKTLTKFFLMAVIAMFAGAAADAQAQVGLLSGGFIDYLMELDQEHQDLIDEWTDKATNNPDSDCVLYGKVDEGGVRYVEMAESLGCTYFALPDKDWDDLKEKHGREFLWEINENFIKRQHEKEKEVILSHDPVGATGAFGNEVQTLEGLGYTFGAMSGIWFGTPGNGQ